MSPQTTIFVRLAGALLAIAPGFFIMPALAFAFFATFVMRNLNQNLTFALWGGGLLAFMVAVVSMFLPRFGHRIRYLMPPLYVFGLLATYLMLERIPKLDWTLITGTASLIALFSLSAYAAFRSAPNTLSADAPANSERPGP